MMRRAPKLSPRLHGAVAATPGSRGPTRRGGVTANAAAPKYSWAISGPLSTVKAGHPRYLSSTVAPPDLAALGARTATFQAGHASSILVTRSMA